MNRAEIERDHWVERYLAGRLSDADARQFEAYWSENPEVMRDLEACARIKGGLGTLRARGELDALVRGNAWWPGRLRLLVLAACAVFAVAGLAIWRSASEPRSVQLAAAVGALPDHAALVAGERYTLLRLRSTASIDALIELPVPPAALELRVLPEVTAEAPRYIASLAPEPAAGNAPAPVMVRDLSAGSDGFVALFVDSRTLAPGRYRLRIAPQPATAQAAAADADGTSPRDVAAETAALAAAGSGFVLEVRGAGEVASP